MQPVKFEIPTVIEWDTWKQTVLPRIRRATRYKIPHLPQLDPCKDKAILVGAGPTAVSYTNEIKSIMNSKLQFGNVLFSVNATHDWLIKQDLVPSIHVLFEQDLDDVRTALGGDPHPDVTYYICSHCHPNLFTQLDGYRKVLWHAYFPMHGYQRAIAKHFPGEFMVAGGYATFFRTLTIAIILGYRDFDLFGLDSSFEASSHLDGYEMSNKEPQVNIWGKDAETGALRKFLTQGGLAFQANEFLEFCKINQCGLSLRVHGDGLLRYVHKSRYPEQYLTEKG